MNRREGYVQIGTRLVGPGEPCYVIAEVGPNHNGDVEIAKKLIDVAVRAGADAVKFQKRKLKEVYAEALIQDPRRGEQGIQYLVPFLIEFELTDAQFLDLNGYCAEKGITFLCTPWDRNSVDFLETLKVPAYKIGSPDMTNLPLIEYVLETGKPVLVSTGMATEQEIRKTLAFLKENDASAALFHCVSTYPVSPEEINLRFMQTLRNWSGFPVGYSGHDTGTATSLAAIGLGASLLEKHITLDRSMRGPDHKASLLPEEFTTLVQEIREVEAALGGSQRWITRGEVLNRRVLGKSLVATRDLKEGSLVAHADVGSKSPGMGLSPQKMDDIVGTRLNRFVSKDEMFVESDILGRVTASVDEKVDVGLPWGIIARFNDVNPLVERFAPLGMQLIEFHVSDRDLDEGLKAFAKKEYPYELVIHAPEYCHEQLIDLCSSDESQRTMSVHRIQKTIDLARELAPFFQNVSPAGPRIVTHVGGMSPTPGRYDLDSAISTLQRSIGELDTDGVDFLLENLPPYPWYFGGRWFGHVLTDAETTARVCELTGLGLCFDTSHAALECHRSGADLTEFARLVLPHVHHLHLSDGAGVSGEGLQLGEGHVNFVELMPLFARTGATCVPEIWMGHHDNGDGFAVALRRLTEANWASRAVAGADAVVSARLEMFIVPQTATLSSALKAIDANRFGVAFIVDETGRMCGVATDGDVRRALLAGRQLTEQVSAAMNSDFVYASPDSSASEIDALLSNRIRVVPVLNSAHHVIDFASIFERGTVGKKR